MHKNFLFLRRKEMTVPVPGLHTCIYTYDHYFQTSSLKRHGQSKPNFMWSLLWKGEMKVNINGPDHMTKMAAMHIYMHVHVL